jgi:hypothetical protein
MKSKFLSILSSTPDEGSAADVPANSQQTAINYRARYQAFLSQQAQRPQRSLNETNGLVRFVQAVLSFSIFVVMFLTILTLFGFGLSKLGVIAQVSPDGVSAPVRQSDSPENHSPSKSIPKKRAKGK